MADLCMPDVALWQMVEDRSRNILALYGCQEIRTPLLEKKELFVRSLGDTTEVVQKEMYTLIDRGGRELCLRPEGTAGVMRFMATGGADRERARVFYLGPMFRAERPQAGRKRQFHQVGAEIMGPPNPAADAECLAMQRHLLVALGLTKFTIHLNTRGLPEDRAPVAAGLRAALADHRAALCPDCQRRFEENILRVLDCKQAACAGILDRLPPVTDFMGAPARDYFQQVCDYLRLLNLEVRINPRLVRGLDYYQHTVWEITCPELGAQDALAGGGRYQLDLDDHPVTGVGFAMGMERLVLALINGGCKPESLAPKPRAVLVAQGPRAFRENLILAMMLRERNLFVEMDLSGRSLKAQMRGADRSGAQWVVIRGDRELDAGVFLLKNMTASTQEEVSLPDLMKHLAAAP